MVVIMTSGVARVELKGHNIFFRMEPPNTFPFPFLFPRLTRPSPSALDFRLRVLRFDLREKIGTPDCRTSRDVSFSAFLTDCVLNS